MLMVAERSSPRDGLRARREHHASETSLGHAQIAQIQRARVLAAMLEVACEQGAANVTVAHVVARSGVSRRTFYEAFADREDCFLAALDDALTLAAARVTAAYGAPGRWHKRIRAALTALLCFLDEEPKLGRLLVCESLSGGKVALQRRNNTIARLIAAVDEGRKESGSAQSLPVLTAEGAVGAVLSILHTHLESDARQPAVALVNPLMGMIVLPYLGAAAARRELAHRVEMPASVERGGGMLADPFKGAGMRLTYRTVRVLLAVAEHPNISNRQLGERAGISDQGQISKLLGRLARLGLIENIGMAPGQGGPNAWTLTNTGRQMTKSIHDHTQTHNRETQ